jgi:hypothetical protein
MREAHYRQFPEKGQWTGNPPWLKRGSPANRNNEKELAKCLLEFQLLKGRNPVVDSFSN